MFDNLTKIFCIHQLEKMLYLINKNVKQFFYFNQNFILFIYHGE